MPDHYLMQDISESLHFIAVAVGLIALMKAWEILVLRRRK